MNVKGLLRNHVSQCGCWTMSSKICTLCPCRRLISVTFVVIELACLLMFGFSFQFHLKSILCITEFSWAMEIIFPWCPLELLAVDFNQRHGINICWSMNFPVKNHNFFLWFSKILILSWLGRSIATSKLPKTVEKEWDRNLEFPR
jgi:hypothetical protein